MQGSKNSLHLEILELLLNKEPTTFQTAAVLQIPCSARACYQF